MWEVHPKLGAPYICTFICADVLVCTCIRFASVPLSLGIFFASLFVGLLYFYRKHYILKCEEVSITSYVYDVKGLDGDVDELNVIVTERIEVVADIQTVYKDAMKELNQTFYSSELTYRNYKSTLDELYERAMFTAQYIVSDDAEDTEERTQEMNSYINAIKAITKAFVDRRNQKLVYDADLVQHAMDMADAVRLYSTREDSHEIN